MDNQPVSPAKGRGFLTRTRPPIFSSQRNRKHMWQRWDDGGEKILQRSPFSPNPSCMTGARITDCHPAPTTYNSRVVRCLLLHGYVFLFNLPHPFPPRVFLFWTFSSLK